VLQWGKKRWVRTSMRSTATAISAVPRTPPGKTASTSAMTRALPFHSGEFDSMRPARLSVRRIVV
jgi:hypothetical protein